MHLVIQSIEEVIIGYLLFSSNTILFFDLSLLLLATQEQVNDDRSDGSEDDSK